MSSSSVIVKGIGKRFVVNELRHRSTLSERVGRLLARPFNRRPAAADDEGSVLPDAIWALRDVSFDVEPGKVLGVIGRNGSGKSTLLKILARITTPTEGSAVLSGRVGALLEVGTGFHPDLSGRENILLNGTILGMTPREVRSREAAIIDFSEVEDFIDTPVKHYSSGMFMRLAFAVAAHLEAEIMLVDEVLAVGDAEFQEKCKAKIRAIAQSGRTVLFTSHNMVAVKRLCHACIILDHGRLVHLGDTNEGVRLYRQMSGVSATEDSEASSGETLPPAVSAERDA
jgi:lipopolysaccharide transport system ATP-binding protein